MEEIVGRIAEQKQLAQLLDSSDAELLAIYGRRRVGKTYLIRNAYEKQLVFEFSGSHNATLANQLELFGKAMSTAMGFPIAAPTGWLQAFEQLTRLLEPKMKKQKKVVFIDEFPWLHTPKSGFKEAFEHFWNMWASKQKNLIVVICGSAAAWMIKNIVNDRGGLHNRITRKMRLLPFTLGEAEEFLRRRNIKLDRYQLTQLYMVMGGVPQYLKMIDRGESVTSAIDRICFTKDGFLNKEFENLFARNRIFMERTIGGGAISAERALNYGFTGPNLRAAGVDYDVRVHQPYSSYQDFDFTIPVGKTGDNYDRFLVRNQEMWQSLSIIEQAYKKVQAFKGTDAEIFHADVPEYYLPKKEDVYTKMESLIWHFKIVMGEVEMPKGEIYNAVEGGNGELGFYLVSDGGRTPFRLHFRRPCFIYYQAYPELITGGMLSDAIVTMSSLNLIAGELDA